ncbi:MAG: efflux RND transporter permease subunit, partial [Candidatus Moraniibacteriota bacterium]
MTYTKNFFDRLHFDESLRNGLVGRYFQSTRAIILITATLIIAGTVSYISLKKELNPDIQIPTVIIGTAFPGAGPEDIEDLVTIPIEDAVNGLSDVTRVTSNSQESFSSIVVEFSSTVDPEKAKSDVQNAVDRVTTLPDASQDPSVEVIDFQNQPVMLFALSAPDDESALPIIADELLDRIKALPAVEKVDLTYRRDPEISILLSPESIAAHNLNIPLLARTIETALGNFPGGTLAASGTALSLDQEKSVRSVAALRTLPVTLAGQTVPLGSLAEIVEREQPGTLPAFVLSHAHDASRAIFFAAYQTESADTRVTIESIESAIAEYRAISPVAFTVSTYFNGSEEIDRSFSQLQRDFLITFGLVFIMLLLFFGVRQSLIAAFAIPFTFLATFVVMRSVGISINFISLFSLLLALGILVDNAIVVISAIASYH